MTTTLVSAKTGEILATAATTFNADTKERSPEDFVYGVTFFIKVTMSQDQP